MKIQAINSYQHQGHARKNVVRASNTERQSYLNTHSNQPSFKGTKGGLIGILSGAAAGAGLAAFTVLTGGLAGVVAAVGMAGTVIGGAAAGTHIGGIAGSIIEDKLEKDNENK